MEAALSGPLERISPGMALQTASTGRMSIIPNNDGGKLSVIGTLTRIWPQQPVSETSNTGSHGGAHFVVPFPAMWFNLHVYCQRQAS